jgi:hypothetical protein
VKFDFTGVALEDFLIHRFEFFVELHCHKLLLEYRGVFAPVFDNEEPLSNEYADSF